MTWIMALIGGAGALLGFVVKWLLGRRTQKLKDAAAQGKLEAARAETATLTVEKQALEQLTDEQLAEGERMSRAAKALREGAAKARLDAERAAAGDAGAAGELLDGVLEDPRRGTSSDRSSASPLRGAPTPPLGTRPGKRPSRG